MQTDLDTMLAAAAVSAPKTKKTDTPVVRSEVLDEKLKRLQEAKRLLKDLEAETKLLAAECMPAAEALRLDLSRQTGAALSSIRINGVVKLVVQNKYSKIPATNEGDLKARFNEQFADYFTKHSEVKVDVSKLTLEALQALLACGAASVEQFYKPTDVFHAAATLDPNVQQLAEGAGIKPTAYFME